MPSSRENSVDFQKDASSEAHALMGSYGTWEENDGEFARPRGINTPLVLNLASRGFARLHRSSLSGLRLTRLSSTRMVLRDLSHEQRFILLPTLVCQVLGRDATLARCTTCARPTPFTVGAVLAP